MSDAADIIFREAKWRCYISVEPSKGKLAMEVDNEDAWKALDEIQGGNGNKGKGKEKGKKRWKTLLASIHCRAYSRRTA